MSSTDASGGPAPTEISRGRYILEWVLIIAAAFGLAILVRIFVAEPFQVPTESMTDTILAGDIIWAEKISYRFGEPQQGDVVTFRSLEDEDTTLVKRTIATAGQTVDLVDGYVEVDGKRLDEPYVNGKPSEPLEMQWAGAGGLTYPLTVPDGCIWVMGDNRTNSRDSRYFGPVPVSNVTGHAMFVSWPLSDIHAL